MLSVTLDETHRCAIAHLAPGERLIVTAPPAEVEITGKPDQPWVWLRFDDFGVRPRFGRNLFATVGLLDRPSGMYGRAMKAGEALGGFGVARLRGHLEGTKRKPRWVPDDFEVSAVGGAVRVDAMAEFEAMLAALAAEGLSIPGAEVLRLFRLAMSATSKAGI